MTANGNLADSNAEMREREKFVSWYTMNAFDYESNPIGSRECALMWKAWQARANEGDLS